MNPEKQFFYCFSCKTHGNAIDFLINYKKLTFIESLKELSAINGIQINQHLKKIFSKQPNLYKLNLYMLMNKLKDYYKSMLTKKKFYYAYNYLQKRGLNRESIENFNIGFAPPGWNNIINQFSSNSHNLISLKKLGMLIKNNNHTYDLFRNRLMFPIYNHSGNIIAFGGRNISKNTKLPKYLNSPDTEIFQKSQCIYGIYEVCKKNRNIPYLLLVEGYLDVITLTQFGINYAVSTLGTSTSIYHIQNLYKFTNQIICCYDGDLAGKKAAWRTLKITLPYLTDNRQLRFMFLPKQEDPDTLIRKIGKNNFLKEIKKSQEFPDFLFQILSKKIDISNISGRIKLINSVLPILKKIPGKMLKICLSQHLSNKIGIFDQNQLEKLIQKEKKIYISQENSSKYEYTIKHTTLNILISLLVKNPHFVKFIPTVQGLENYHEKDISIFIKIIQICKNNKKITYEKLLTYFYKDALYLKLKKLIRWNIFIKDNIAQKIFIDALTKLYDSILKQQQENLIAKDRISGLTLNERKTLWSLTKNLSIF